MRIDENNADALVWIIGMICATIVVVTMLMVKGGKW